jgi:hypothetical protein
MTYRNLWDTAKAVLRGKFIDMNTYIKRTESSQINDLMLHLKLLEKQKQANTKTSRRREIIKVRAEINKTETKKSIQRINETKSWFFKKLSKIDRPQANLTKSRTEKTQISKIRNAKGDKTTNTMEIQEVIRYYFENLNSNKFEHLEQMDRFLDTCDHPKLNQEDINHLDTWIDLQHKMKLSSNKKSPKKENSRT